MSSLSELTAHTGFWMRMVSNAVSQDFARRVADEGVTVAEWVFLRALYDETAMSPSMLAGKMGMTRGAISKLAERLIAKGMIDRSRDMADGRAHTLQLSDEGRAKVPVLAGLADENDADYFGVLDAGEHAALDRLLKTLVERRQLKAVPLD
jgi:DNA-binding MarR family transcriptional regulator